MNKFVPKKTNKIRIFPQPLPIHFNCRCTRIPIDKRAIYDLILKLTYQNFKQN